MPQPPNTILNRGRRNSISTISEAWGQRRGVALVPNAPSQLRQVEGCREDAPPRANSCQPYAFDGAVAGRDRSVFDGARAKKDRVFLKGHLRRSSVGNHSELPAFRGAQMAVDVLHPVPASSEASSVSTPSSSQSSLLGSVVQAIASGATSVAEDVLESIRNLFEVDYEAITGVPPGSTQPTTTAVSSQSSVPEATNPLNYLPVVLEVQRPCLPGKSSWPPPLTSISSSESSSIAVITTSVAASSSTATVDSIADQPPRPNTSSGSQTTSTVSTNATSAFFSDSGSSSTVVATTQPNDRTGLLSGRENTPGCLLSALYRLISCCCPG